MSANPGRVGGTVVGILALVIVFLVFLKPDTKSNAYQPSSSSRQVHGELTFRGQGNRSLNRIIVASNAEAEFDCPSCASFAITSTDPANPTDGLNDASPSGSSAQFPVTAGTYSNVHVKTGDNAWTLRILPVSGR